MKKEVMEKDCRHVAPSDDPFTARMRFHQSWFRRHILNLPPGHNPHARGTLYGNMLTPEDGNLGRNFLTPSIFKIAKNRLAEENGVIEPNRLKNNMLSSQPMCFNLFGPLCGVSPLATHLIKSLPGMEKIQDVNEVKIEFRPPKENHLQDNTAFDAFVEYKREDGGKGFVGIETKLTEPFSQKDYPFKPRYAKWKEHESWWWKDGAEEDFPNPLFNQLWRNHLLAFSMLHQSKPAYSEGFCAVVYHENDNKCEKAIEEYRKRLKPEGDKTLLNWSLSKILDTWDPVLEDSEGKEWLKTFRLRYMDMGASKPAWLESGLMAK